MAKERYFENVNNILKTNRKLTLIIVILSMIIMFFSYTTIKLINEKKKNVEYFAVSADGQVFEIKKLLQNYKSDALLRTFSKDFIKLFYQLSWEDFQENNQNSKFYSTLKLMNPEYAEKVEILFTIEKAVKVKRDKSITLEQLYRLFEYHYRIDGDIQIDVINNEKTPNKFYKVRARFIREYTCKKDINSNEYNTIKKEMDILIILEDYDASAKEGKLNILEATGLRVRTIIEKDNNNKNEYEEYLKKNE